MFNWYHEVDIEWLQARRLVLTATDIRKHKTDTNKILKMDPGEYQVLPGFASLWAEKKSDMIDLDTRSYDAMARGHILEPYAVESFNEAQITDKIMYHWDDCIIARNRIGFSPDSLSVPQLTYGHMLAVMDSGKMVDKDHTVYDAPGSVLEIKSYMPAAHMKAWLEDKMKLDERWQLAVAMYVCPIIRYGYLFFYDPDNKVPGSFYQKYTAQDLIEEISTVHKVSEYWRWLCEHFENFDEPEIVSLYTEEQIYENYIAQRDDVFTFRR